MLTLEQVRTEAGRVLERFGADHKNPVSQTESEDTQGCSYTSDHNEHCIAGQILVNLGVEVPGYGHPDNQKFVFALFADSFLLDREAILWLDTAQKSADQGCTWEQAIESANTATADETD